MSLCQIKENIKFKFLPPPPHPKIQNNTCIFVAVERSHEAIQMNNLRHDAGTEGGTDPVPIVIVIINQYNCGVSILQHVPLDPSKLSGRMPPKQFADFFIQTFPWIFLPDSFTDFCSEFGGLICIELYTIELEIFPLFCLLFFLNFEHVQTIIIMCI